MYGEIRNCSDIKFIICIQRELEGCRNNIGYRQMWMILKQKYALTVKRYMHVFFCICTSSKCHKQEHSTNDDDVCP